MVARVTDGEQKAVRDAQVFMSSLTSKPLVADGWWGTYSMSVYASLTAVGKIAVDAIFVANGTTAQRVRTSFAALKVANPSAKTEALEVRSGSKPQQVRGGVVAAIAAKAKASNIVGASLVNLLANIEVESNFVSRSEDHRYSGSSARANIRAFAKTSDKDIANLVSQGKAAFFEAAYGKGTAKGKDLGNINVGDGGKYYGRGYLQITGKWNYEAFQRYSGIQVVNDPDLLLQEDNAIASAIWYWKVFVMKTNRDRDLKLSAVAVNGGKNGLDARLVAAKKYEAIFA